MTQFRTLQSLDDTIGLRRISRERAVSGFDLFTDADTPTQELHSLCLGHPSPEHPAICAKAFSCTARPIGETPEGLLFADGVTLAEFCGSAFASSEKPNSETVLGPLLSAFHAIWSLLRELERSGFTLQEFRPGEILRQESVSNADWRILPTPNIVPFCGTETCRRQFTRWISTLPHSFPLTVQTLQEIASLPQWNAWQNAALENGTLWTPYVPEKPFHSLKVERSGLQLTLKWETQENRTVSDPVSVTGPKTGTKTGTNTDTGSGNSTAASGTNAGAVHLFEMLPGKRFPKNCPLLPTNALSEFCGREFPLRSGENAVQITLSGPEPLRLCGIRILGGWARPGRIFRAGGPEDVTFFDIYRDEDTLVLDLDWPNHIERAQIAASPKQFPAGPQQGPEADSDTKVWFHDRFNPLIPKRIPLSEFKGWNEIFLRVFSIADTPRERIFSLGNAPQSRRRITLPNE